MQFEKSPVCNLILFADDISRCIGNNSRYVHSNEIVVQQLEICITKNDLFSSFRLFRAPKDVKFVEGNDSLKGEHDDSASAKVPFKPTIQWSTVFVNLFIHFGALVGVYQLLTLQPKWQTYIWCEFPFFTAKHFSLRNFIDFSPPTHSRARHRCL